MNDQRFFDLAIKVIAGQATDTQRADLDALLAQEPEFRAEFERLKTDAGVATDALPLITACTASTDEFPAYARERLKTAVQRTLGRPESGTRQLLAKCNRLFSPSSWNAPTLAFATLGCVCVGAFIIWAKLSSTGAGNTKDTDQFAGVREESRRQVLSVPAQQEWNLGNPVSVTFSAPPHESPRQSASTSVTGITQAPGNYTAAEAAQHVGETATVTDKVESFHRSEQGNILLNMGGKYPNQVFAAVIPSERAASFPNAQEYEGRTVSVLGKISLYEGKPEIIVTMHSQIIQK